MERRAFGETDMQVSRVGFGAWGIGGDYGPIETSTAISALSRAEELGCNFVDTASVYSASEEVLGQFLPGRRDKWLVATKYSGQPGGVVAHAEQQLKTMGIDVIDFYQLHWAPREDEQELWDGLYELKASGKARYVGVSLYTAEDIDYVIGKQQIDGFQVKFSLLDPEPFLSCRDRVLSSGLGVIIRSSLREGFLTGKFTGEWVFEDQIRRKWSREKIQDTVAAAERFRFLEDACRSMAAGAARYCLSFDEVSTLILGAKTPEQAEMNLAAGVAGGLSGDVLERIGGLREEAQAFQEKYEK